MGTEEREREISRYLLGVVCRPWLRGDCVRGVPFDAREPVGSVKGTLRSAEKRLRKREDDQFLSFLGCVF